jgi:methylase of polypeptide subunit release factors
MTAPATDRSVAAATHTRIRRLSYGVYQGGISRLRRNRCLFRLLFGFTPLPEALAHGGWDWTTLALRSVLRRRCTRETALLDLGTGPSAVLATYAALRLGCRDVWASDREAWIVESAARQSTHAGAAVHCVCGDLFDAVRRRFDLVVFNAPYLSSARSPGWGLLQTAVERARFAGGPDGCRTIERFLSRLPESLTPGGVGALGVNAFHVSRHRVEELVARSGLECMGVVSTPVVRSHAYLLQRSGG